MSELRQAAEMALKALENADTDTLVEVKPHVWEYRGSLVIQALRQALAEPEDPRITELTTLMAEPEVTGVVFEVHRGPLSKSIREFGECPCPTHVEGDVRIEVKDRTWVGLTTAEVIRCQEVYYFDTYANIEAELKDKNSAPYTKLDTTAGVLHKEWVGLTDEDIDVYALDIGVTANKAPSWLVKYARDIEAALKEKNRG